MTRAYTRLSRGRSLLTGLLAGLAFLGAASADGKEFDLVISNGRVVDPASGLDAVRNIGIDEGRITKITSKKIEGAKVIDAKGLVVAPGFIDTHNHNVTSAFGQKLALRDGVTSPLELEAGVYPVDEWYASMKGRSQANYGASVGVIPVREHTLNPEYRSQFAGDFLYDMSVPDQAHTSMKWSTEVADDDQIELIAKRIDEGLAQGALGVGHCPGYMVSGVTQRESTAAQRLAAKHGAFVSLHARYSSQLPPASGLLGFAELMGPQAVYGGGLILDHMTAQALDVTPDALALVDDARGKGIQVIAEIYPYDFGATIAGADYLHPDNYQRNMGRDYEDIIEVSNLKPLTKARYEELVKTAPGTSVMFYNAKEQTVYDALAHPNTILGSDAFTYSLKDGGGPAVDWDTPYDAVNGHPRGAGAHAKLLRLVREGKVKISLSDAIAKMSTLPADFLAANGVEQMKRKGRIEKGADADLTIFDPKKVTDNSTMKDGGLPSTGIPYVVVGGTVVVDDSKVLEGVYPGQAIRRSPSR